MSGKWIDQLYNIVIQFRWKYIVIFFILFFGGSWWLTDFVEPHTELTKPAIYWWYFLNNVLRGGDSGFNPSSLGGRIVSMVSFFCGGIFFIATLCKATAVMYEHSQKRKKGLARMKAKNHIVILGYRKGETEGLVTQLMAENVIRKKTIVMCSRHLEDNPLPGLVTFIKGDTASEDVMVNACVADADVIVISGHTDERSITIAIVAHRKNPKAHIVVYLEDRENYRFLALISQRIECVTSLRTMLIAQAVLNPGVTPLIREMVSLDDPGTIYRINIPSEVPPIRFHELCSIMQTNYRSIVTGYSRTCSTDDQPLLNPDPYEMISGGMSLFYISEQRMDGKIDWSLFRSPPSLVEFMDDTYQKSVHT